MNIGMPVISKFSYNYQETIQTYCDNINQCTADMFIVMARKGVCFFDILRDDGLICLSSGQKKISSSAMDFLPAISPHTKVVVTDDIMISGTSISDVINRLLDWGVPEENISIIVLAIDSENMKLDFTTESRINLLHQGWSLSNADCIELSSQISNVLSLFGRPYDVDFPVYNPVKVRKSVVHNLLSPKYWQMYNVTNTNQALGGIDAITLIPVQKEVKTIWKSIGLESQDFAHLKIRLYIKDIDSEFLSIQIVPFILFYEISYEQIDELCVKLTNSTFPEYTHSARLRICQFILCHRFAYFFSNVSKCRINLSFRESVVTSLFGYNFASKIFNLLYPQSNICENLIFEYHDAPIDLLDYSTDNCSSCLDSIQKIPFHNASPDGRELNYQLLQPFISWYLSRELPTRQELAEGNYNFRTHRKLVHDKTYRLDSGYSFRALNTIFLDCEEIYRWPDVTSIFLDRAIDMGIIVPIMFDNDKNRTVCRAFRHGEDLPFGVADKSRVLYFLQQLQKEFEKRKCEGIARVSLEKIIVLFIQMSLRDKGVFNQFLGFHNSEVLSIRYSVHGAVATTIDPSVDRSKLKYYFDSAPYWDWITNYLSKKGMILQQSSIKNNPNDYICANAFNDYEKQFNNICNEIQVKIKKYASIFAEWYGAMHLRQRDEFKTQVIQLSTCFSLPTVAAALATELHYFYRYWLEEVQIGFDRFLETSDANVKLKIPGADAAKVLNSGREKYQWFEDKAHITAIRAVKESLESKSSYLSADWEGKWHSIAASRRQFTPTLVAKYHECYCYLLLCCVCYELLAGGEMADKDTSEICRESQKRIAEYEKQFLDVKTKNDLSIDDFNELFLFVTKGNFELSDISERIQALKKLMDRILMYANEVVEEIQTLVSEQMMDVPVYFNICLIAELQCNDSKCSSIVEDAWDNLPDDGHKTLINIFKLMDNVNGEHFQRYGIFYAYNDEISSKTQFSMQPLISYILQSADRNCINCRFVFIPELPSQCRLKYSYRSNMQAEIDHFNRLVCNKISPYFGVRTSSQIMLVQKSGLPIPDDLQQITELIKKNSKILDQEKLNWYTLSDYSITRFVNTHESFPYLSHQNATKNAIACLFYFDEIQNEIAGCAGTATLFRYEDSIYAFVCMHSLSDRVNQVYALKLKTYGYHMLYGKSTIKKIDSENLSAKLEVAVLKIYWDPECTEEAYFEPGTILDIDADYNSSIELPFTCFGYPSNRGVTVRSSVSYEANDGYQEFIIDDNDNFEGGFSGALFIDKNQNPHAIAYSYQNSSRTHAYGIPMSLAVMRAHEILDEGD